MVGHMVSTQAPQQTNALPVGTYGIEGIEEWWNTTTTTTTNNNNNNSNTKTKTTRVCARHHLCTSPLHILMVSTPLHSAPPNYTIPPTYRCKVALIQCKAVINTSRQHNHITLVHGNANPPVSLITHIKVPCEKKHILYVWEYVCGWCADGSDALCNHLLLHIYTVSSHNTTIHTKLNNKIKQQN